MLYKIVETKRGKERIVLVDQLKKCNDRIKELRNSRRGSGVIFRIEESIENNKMEAKPLSQAWRAGDYGLIPKVIKD
jgi:hypothetical protein